ncbi:protein-methionine-sulfoxide reductase heme-binding subunit MsrQ [Maricaulis sp. CAU 1757]
MSRRPLLRGFARHALKPLAFWLLALPGLYMGWQWYLLLSGASHELGFNPIETTHRFLGDTALRILLISLAVTPFRDLTGWLPIMRIRRRIGLAAFWYAVLHLAAYLFLDKYLAAGGSVAGMMSGWWEDIVERVYITLGMTALVLLVPLALTSFNSMVRRLGAARWQRLHYLVYPIATLAVLHHGFMEKGNQLGPWIHGGILAALLGYRLWAWRRRAARPAAAA